MILHLLVGCDTPVPVEAPPAPVEEALVLLEGPALLRRISLDLRGVLPSADELDAVEADPERVWEIRDAYLDDPRLEDRLVEVFHLHVHTLIAEYEWTWGDLFPQDTNMRNSALNRQIGEEPLRYMARVAAEDRPWTDVVTGDTTMATPLLASFTSVDYEEGDTGWEEVRYTDGRPAAGVLAMNAMWWRYESTNANNNRSRAAAITRIFLCRDLLDRPVSFSATGGSLSTEEIEDAVHGEPGCLACHATLDPIAVTLFGFYVVPAESVTWRPEREALGEAALGLEPAYYGTPVDDLGDVGDQIAADPRFPRCTVEQLASTFWARDLGDDDAAVLDGLEADFLSGGLRLKGLLAGLTESEAYRHGALAMDATEGQIIGAAAARMMTPDVLADATEELTGFRWALNDTDLLSDDEAGFRTVAGGVDGLNQLRSQRVPGAMWALVTKRVAEAAAGHVVDRAKSDGGPLFVHAHLSTRPGDPAFAREVRALAWRLTARRLSPPEVAALEALWTDVDAQSDTRDAWVAVISVLLRDPGYLFF